MADMLTLTPEQLFFLGTLMDAEYINYEYIAALGELQRNYSRTRRKCLNELAGAGIIRERLSGEISLRPAPKKLLRNLFFGKTETALEIFTLGKQATRTAFRFHWLEDAVTRVRVEKDRFVLTQSSAEEIESLVLELVSGTEQPVPAAGIEKETVTRMITAKRATVGVGSAGIVLFEQPGGLYAIDDTGKPTGIPASQARSMILSELKGE